MIVMITSDFYSEYELYRTDDFEGLKDLYKEYLEQGEIEIDINKYKLLCCQDDITTEAALKIADQVLYIGDIESELENEQAARDQGQEG